MTDITPPSHAGVSAAAATLAPYLSPTPLVRAEILSRAFDADVWIKNETVSPVASTPCCAPSMTRARTAR